MKFKFKDLTEDQKKKIAEIYTSKDLSWQDKENALSQYTGRNARTVRGWCKDWGLTSGPTEAAEYDEARNKKFNKKKKCFLVTWAQNNTPVHRKFLANLEAYAEHINADIHVIAGRYKNPTSIWTMGQQEEERWSRFVKPYLDAGRHEVHRYMTIMSDVKIHPTAINPMSGLYALSHENSCIFGSPKLQMEMISALESSKPKMMLTTGACTVPNYTDSKEGKKSEFHHVLGFCIVEIKDKETFFVRQVSADDEGNFTDLYHDVKFDGELTLEPLGTYDIDKPYVLDGETNISRVTEIEACVLGDLHVGHHDPEVLEKTHEFLDKVRPTHVVLHDVFDGYSISHHDEKDKIKQYSKEFHGKNDLNKELEEMFDVLSEFDKRYDSIIISRANHDDFADRWVINQDWKKQSTPKNYKLYSKFMNMMLSEVEVNPNNPRGVIPMLINERLPNFNTLGRRDSFKIKGWEVGMHGDVGSNGTRGSHQQYRRLNTKVIVGHYHTPQRKDGALAVGTSTHLRVGYNNGPSSWLQSHVIIHKSGKAQHLNFINGEFTTFE
jgi:hypothetical protein